ncbi:sugar hydrolase [Paenibacillus enshidis]|uniref:Sugar hydrolase n=1 Tax=Paenibacillus enshidis TaxID=1458439 RepID=A0ABV5AXF8_9BACL
MSEILQKRDGLIIKKNEAFAAKAEALKPVLLQREQRPQHIVQVVSDERVIHGWRVERETSAESLPARVLGKGEQIIVDFGDHLVGSLSMSIKPVGSPPDAPLYLKLTFGEMPVEMAVPFSEYDGWLSRSWLQEEYAHVDVLPGVIKLDRRYSFRYLKLEVLDTSPKYKVSVEDICCTTVTSGDRDRVGGLDHTDPELQAIDSISIKTLEDCMQEVFEDGPKRDRRLWLGDLRLQAIANYDTFQNNDLVKRCLYLFAAFPNDQGQVTANLFIKPEVIPDDTFILDYSLLFVSTLHDYYLATGDKETLEELWPTAFRQIEIGFEQLDERLIVKDSETWYSFIDWHPELNKQAPSQGVLIYAMKQALYLSGLLQDDRQEELHRKIHEVQAAAMKHLWSEEEGYFISGKDEQVSWAAQVWMVLAGVLDKEKSSVLLLRVLDEKPGTPLMTPYMMHHLIEALIQVGERDRAILEMKQYWGGMVRDGADTFWELYDPQNKEFSPYGSYLINSYCHAWSCTPTYFIRRYKL